ALVLSIAHIAFSLYLLRLIAQDFSLQPLDDYQPIYGLLNPLAIMALGFFFAGPSNEPAEPVSPG
ncbi:MAG TPA: hypothetical protein VMK65_01185, partial [Longimicrobiales bacterium]|nr:hypothetical protein [Longimicrobiales bacterium]